MFVTMKPKCRTDPKRHKKVKGKKYIYLQKQKADVAAEKVLMKTHQGEEHRRDTNDCLRQRTILK